MRRLVCRLLTAVLAALALITTGTPAHAAAPASPAVTFTNPIAEKRADPHIFKHTDGYYYFTATVPEYDRIVMRRATTLQGLSTAPETTIWTKHSSGVMGAHIWAPEVHFIDGKWYVYFAAGATNDIWAIRMYVLETSAANPLTGTWTEKGQIKTTWETFSLDATTFVVNGTRYLSWAQRNPAENNNTSIFIAKMLNPWTISGTPAEISQPTLSWETIGYKVNEGPAVIQKNGKVFLTYSASATDSNYCLGMLTASATADLLNPASWTKSQQPVFKTNASTSQYGPGHNSFTVSEDGKSDILVYHDRNYKDISGDPLNDPNRRTRYQKVYWNADGTPNFGIPVADGVTPVRLSSYNYPGKFIRHWEYRAKLEANVTNLADSQFRIVPGLAGNGTVSLESANFPGYYLRHKNFELWVEKDDGTTLFDGDASFFERSGLADSAAGVSYESYNFPGRYLRHYNNLIYAQPISTDLDRQDATFYKE
ncbi:alpha-arabinofuranosidase [Streptomyces ipomoeae]|uniref:Glycosyl hydrolase, family 43 n=2 Tax=Streptomyces ipomoeae TaxID=103232 RepID=L1L988_9ACTN|nr:family 43 glycosylhydrolase [Streptomyces ipomoeae]EKX69354.1 glycosyl hydrolase, family 43 [Streptomyces ipomoeae 91-03]MDX2700078.1 family 43 glycosylhydrolase [Streptomyces ipomoeae]MDX2827660.1 family 43 glycosylhydrolase [Streptomyces ipomoeae]MDX2845711.1 family 43 glycosylhydrolase [Streptomyces ipomoeae]MDX2874086.1 family 43 glycosylhydrolase [Streptomyces ipomoeae]